MESLKKTDTRRDTAAAKPTGRGGGRDVSGSAMTGDKRRTANDAKPAAGRVSRFDQPLRKEPPSSRFTDVDHRRPPPKAGGSNAVAAGAASMLMAREHDIDLRSAAALRQQAYSSNGAGDTRTPYDVDYRDSISSQRQGANVMPVAGKSGNVGKPFLAATGGYHPTAAAATTTAHDQDLRKRAPGAYDGDDNMTSRKRLKTMDAGRGGGRADDFGEAGRLSRRGAFNEQVVGRSGVNMAPDDDSPQVCFCLVQIHTLGSEKSTLALILVRP